MPRYDIEVAGTHNYFVNGVMVHNSPETTTGGKALKFYASVRLDVRRIETLKDGTDPVGNRTRVKVVKNKVSPPFKQAEFDILYGHGISREGGLIDMGVEHGFIRKAGAWYTYEGDQLGQGKENARNFLRDNPDLADEIEKKVKEKLGVGPQGGQARPSRTCPSSSDAEPSCRTRDPRRQAGPRRGRPRESRGSGRGGGAGRGRRSWMPPPEDPAARARRPIPESVARAIVLRQLSMAPRSRAQLERKLSQRGCDPEVAARVLDRMTEVGLVDDEAYAEMLVRSKQARRRVSPARVWPMSCASRGSTRRPRRRRSDRSASTTSAPGPRISSPRSSGP